MAQLLESAKRMVKTVQHTASNTPSRLRSRRIDITKIRTACLALGPYRNLTTLTAGIIALHPHAQVLNHAGDRIFNDPCLNFFSRYDQGKFEAFVRHAIFISQSGKTGDYGGSILLSHAFSGHPEMLEAYKARYGGMQVKQEICSLFWKESLMTSHFIRQRHVDLGFLFEQNSQLRFLMPVRNPLDCAVSNLRTGHVSRFGSLSKESPFNEVLSGVLDEFRWFLELHRSFPGRFYHYFESRFDRDALMRLAEFLQIEPDEDWITASIGVFRIKPSYPHSKDALDFYTGAVKSRFADFPLANEVLMQFADAK